jgi:hypothetical protein
MFNEIMIMYDSKKLFTLAGILILMGALAAGVFRVANSSGYGPTILAISFSKASGLNSEDQYSFNNHGKIVSIEKELYDKSIWWAYMTLGIQFLFWLPAVLIIALVGIRKDEMSWSGLLYGVPGIIIWIIAEFSSPI